MIERGTHAELVARKGEYYDMVRYDATHSEEEEEEKQSGEEDSGMYEY